jgi:hypothetical protein
MLIAPLNCFCGAECIPCTSYSSAGAWQLFRAPHGTPFTLSNSPDLPRVASVVRRHAVNVVWTFAGSNELDWYCDADVQCVLSNYLNYFSSGSSGIPLMHAVKGGTAGSCSLVLARASLHSCLHGTGIPYLTALKNVRDRPV